MILLFILISECLNILKNSNPKTAINGIANVERLNVARVKNRIDKLKYLLVLFLKYLT